MANKTKISEQLRESILRAEISRYRLAKEIGVSEALLSRFVNGVSGLSLETVDKIGDVLGLQITHKRKSKGR